MLAILVGLSFAAVLVAAQTTPQSTGQAAQATTAQSDLTGSISGVIKDAGTGAPLPGAIVVTITPSKAENGTTSKRVNATADAEGRYKLSNLPPGRYPVYVRSADRLGPKGSRIVTLRVGEHLVSIDFALRPYGVISGKVLDDNKEPVPGAMVHAISKEYNFGALEYLVKEGATTDDRGEYVLPLLEPGRPYLLRAEKRERQPVSKVPSDPKLRKRVLAPTYYPNSNAIEGALPLVLRPGERREGVDIEMSRSPSYCIEGTLEAGGRPAALTFSVVEQALSTSDVYKLGGRSGPDGRIRICGLQGGQYRITADEGSPTPTGDPPRFGVTAVTITDEDVRNVKVVAHGGLPLSGRVVWDGTPPDQPVTGKVWISLEPLTRLYFMGEDTDAQSSIPGEFAFPGLLMDDYTVKVPVSVPGVYVKDITYGGRSVRHEPLRLGSATGGAAELRIILGRDGGTVSAKVADKDGNPVPDSYVLIMSGEVHSEPELASALISGQTDQNGLYSSHTLAPGKYYLLESSEPINLTPESIGTLWRARLSKAREVEIGARGTAHVTLELAIID